MNNEEKILDILTAMQSDMIELKTKAISLETKVGGLETKIDSLEAGQKEIAHEVKAIREQTEDLVEFETEMRTELKNINKKLDTVQKATAKNMFDIFELQNRAI